MREAQGGPAEMAHHGHTPAQGPVSLSRGRFRDHYRLGSKIGEGHFGVVRRVVEKSTGREFACKVILRGCSDDGASEELSQQRLQREMELGLEITAGAPGLVRTVEAFQDEQRVYIVMELCEGGTLADYIERRREAWARETEAAREASLKLPEMEAMRRRRRERVEVEAGWVLGELACALAHCHEHHVVHRDMKPENVLILDQLEDGAWLCGIPSSPPPTHAGCCTAPSCPPPTSKQKKGGPVPAASSLKLPGQPTKLLSRVFGSLKGRRVRPSQVPMSATLSAREREENQVKLADFGLAERLPPDGTTGLGFVGSPAYVAPEVVSGGPVGYPSDVWGLGVILYFLLSEGRLPFSGRSTALLLKSIRKGEIDLSSPALVAASADAKDVLCRLLNKDPSQRPTAAEVAQMPWVQEQLKKRALMVLGV